MAEEAAEQVVVAGQEEAQDAPANEVYAPADPQQQQPLEKAAPGEEQQQQPEEAAPGTYAQEEQPVQQEAAPAGDEAAPGTADAPPGDDAYGNNGGSYDYGEQQPAAAASADAVAQARALAAKFASDGNKRPLEHAGGEEPEAKRVHADYAAAGGNPGVSVRGQVKIGIGLMGQPHHRAQPPRSQIQGETTYGPLGETIFTMHITPDKVRVVMLC
jgi:hypothetical protein